MREQEYSSRDKKVQKMTRDGLVEKNLTKGSEQRISARLADISFGREKSAEPIAGHRAEGRIAGKGMRAAERKPDGQAGTGEGTESQEELRETGEKEHRQPEADASGIPQRKAADMPIVRHRGRNPGGRQKRRRQREWGQTQDKGEPAEENRETGSGADSAAAEQAARESAGEGKKRLSDEPPGRKLRQGRLRPEQYRKRNTAYAGEARHRRERLYQDRQQKQEAGRIKEAPEEPRETGWIKEIPEDSRAAGDIRRIRPRERAYEKAEKRAESADKRLRQAREKLPGARRLRMENREGQEAGQGKERLLFDREERAGAFRDTVRYAALSGIHEKLREEEKDNTGLEAAHGAETYAERGAAYFARAAKERQQRRPYRREKRAERRLTHARAELEYRKLLREHPEIRKKALAKQIQRMKIRRKYAQAAREAGGVAKHMQNVFTAAGQAARKLAQAAFTRKTVLGIVAAGGLAAVLSGSLFTSCTAMLSGVESAVVSSCYVADEKEIGDSSLRYTELETDLQLDINHTEETYPDYDEYRYNIGEIGHNPYELMGYLSAVYTDFTYREVAAELERLFDLQYQLTREEIVEIRTDVDEDGEEYEYEWHILQTTLAVTPLSDIIAGRLRAGDEADRYGVYMQTCGNRQCYSNPVDIPWAGYVTSPYGYRVHPVTGEKDLHRGIDIGVAEGTPVKAVQNGYVTSAGDTGDYGLCVTIRGEDGYVSRYAHLASYDVSAGQPVKSGDVIGAAGSTGSSTGPHLHLELLHNGEHLNPYYFVDNGSMGYTPAGCAADSPVFPDDPGTPMGSGSVADMIAEAERYLGMPYVWGGSNPSTGFDCSGYVSWVINHSGAGSVGRMTAQGLFNYCTPVAKDSLQPGDLVFFTGTYSTANPVTHVGIYVGGGRMIHCGDPIGYADIGASRYWNVHFYSGGRLP